MALPASFRWLSKLIQNLRSASSHPLKLQTSAAARACPFQKPLTSAVPPSTSRSVAPKSFLTVSRPPPAPLESFKSSAAPRACPPQRLAPALLKSLKPPRSAPSSVASTQAMSLVPLPASSGPALRGLSGCDRVPAASSGQPPSSGFPHCSKPFAAPPAARAGPFQKPEIFCAVPPSTSRWVAAESFLTVSRPPPAPLESFKSSAAPRACLHPRAARWPQSPFLRFRGRGLPPQILPQRLAPALL